MPKRTPIFVLFGTLAVALLAAFATGAQEVSEDGNPPEGDVTYMGVTTAVHSDISPPLRDIKPFLGGPTKTDKDDPSPKTPCGPIDGYDPVAQTSIPSGSGEAPREMPAPGSAWNAFANVLGYTPPDPVGDVGPDHYVVMANSTIAVYSKSGILLWGPSNINSLWAGFGGDCEANNDGDPVVLYDQFADRWLVSQFTAAGSPYYNCVCLSTSGDPTGTWQRYAFSNGTNGFPDYPKYGIWRDGYYFSTRNTDTGTQGAYALNRAQMLAGSLSPQVVTFVLSPGSTPYYGGDGLLPADADGSTLPPEGSPELFLGTMDNGGPYGAPQDAINIFKFHVDWATPANSTFARSATVPVAAFDSTFTPCAGGRSCIPQPGTTNKIDILSYRQRATFRAAYRNFGTHESIALTQSVSGHNSGTSSAIAGMRWYELRDPNGTPIVYQQGTYVPGATDGVHRWMGSIAMDRRGNMGLGFSASSGSVYPSIRYTGRLATDPLGTMAQGEASIADGAGSQTGSQRWGDYTSLNIDPVDDCTFWYVNQYFTSTSSTTWRMRVGSFTFPSCVCAVTPAAPGSPSVGASADNQITVGWSDSATASITQYFVMRSTTAGGPYTQIATVPDTSPGVGGSGTYSYVDAPVSGGTRYYYAVRANDGDACTSPNSQEVSTLAMGPCLLAPSFGGVTSVANAGSATCALDIAWSSGTSNCGGGLTYNIYRSTAAPFTPDATPGSGNRIASGLSGTSYSDGESLVSGTAYYYIVRAYDAGSGTEDANAVIAVGFPTGPGGGLQTLFSDNFENAATWPNWTVTTGPGPHTCGPFARVNSTSQLPAGGSGYYALSDSDACGSGSTTSTALTSPVIDCNVANLSSVILDFDLYYRHYNGDNATCEVWNGSSWIPVWTDPNSTVNAHQTIDVTAHAQGNASFRVRFNYQNASYDYWYAVDDVVLTGQVNNPCETGGGCTAPGAPNLTAATGTCAGVSLSWSAGTGDTATYNVYRKSAPCGGTYAKIAGPLVATNYSDGSAVAGTNYAYVVRGACDAGGSNESADSNCLTAARLVSPTPTISGDGGNTCPATTVTLTTQSGKSSYQWYHGGSPISGANAYQHAASGTGTYTVSYAEANGCSGTSAGKPVVITAPCAPAVQYDGSYNPVTSLLEICGDGDSVVEPGEEWRVTVRLKNAGNSPSTSTVANLAVNAGSGAAASVAGNPGSFGTLVASGTGTANYQFAVTEATVCNADLVFDVTGIQSAESSFPSQLSAFAVQVGANTPVRDETGTQVTTPLNATSGQANSDLSPAFTISAPDSATLFFGSSYAPATTVSTLFSDEFTSDPASNGWEETGNVTSSTAAPTDACSGGGTNYANIPGGNTAPGNSIQRVVDTTGKSAITLVMDYYYANMDSGEGLFVDYSTAGLGGPFTNIWSHTSTSNNQTANWADDCARTISFPVECENNVAFAVRIRNSASNALEASRVDHLRISGTSTGTGSFTQNAKVDLLDGSGVPTTLKAYGTPAAASYDVKAYYTGPGTYRLRVEENNGGTATLTSASMAVHKDGVTHCTVSACAGVAPPETSPGDMLANAQTWPSNTSHAWTMNPQASLGYRVYRGRQADLPALLGSGLDGCLRWSGPGTACTLDEAPPTAGDFFWYIVVGVNSVGEGSAGFASAGPRQINSRGACP